VTREKARERASVLDAKIHEKLGELLRGSPRDVLSQIRAYLIRRSAEMNTRNNPIQLLKFRKDQNGMALIVLGPAFDKGATTEHFHFDSGARLSFGLALRDRGNGSELVSFRFHCHLAEGRPLEYLRFDLNEKAHVDPLSEPRCHLHPGLEDVRIPMSLHDPIEILDRIFFAADGSL